MKKLGLILFFLGCFFTGISQQKIIIRGAGAIDTTGRFVYNVFLSNDSLFYQKGGDNVYIGKITAVTDDSLQTVMRRSSVLTENGNIVNNTPNEPYYNITMDTAGSKVAYDNLSLKFGHELVWMGGQDSASILNIGNNGILGRVIKNSGNSAELNMTNSTEDIGFKTRFNGLSQYNEATIPSGTFTPGAFHLKTETGAHYAFPRSKPTLNQILKVTDTTTYPNMQVLSWVDGIDSLKVDSVKVYSSTCVDTFKYWVSGTPTTIATVDKQNGLNSGGVVTPAATDTTFDVSAAVYKLLCTRYASAATLVTLNGNSDSSKGRIDVIGVNTSGAVFGLQGTNATNPIAPALSATQLGLATVTFPPLSDSGVVNIYNNFDYNGIDSSAYRSVAVTPDSLCFIFSSLRQSDTICSSRSTAIDSLRRLAGSVNVQARKGGVWITQYTDSVGSGGGGGATTSAIDQVLRNGNRTRQELIWDDTSAVAGSGITTDILYPRNYDTSYTTGKQSYFSRGYGYYPGVNADGRPNVVWLLGGYNGGFNNRVIPNEHTWGLRAETWYQLGGIGHSEFHGFSPEFLPAIGGQSRRLGTWYVNNLTGNSQFTSQGDQYSFLRGASDTVQFSSAMNAFNIGFKTAGSLTMSIMDSGFSNNFNIAKGLTSTTFSISTPSPAAAAVSYMSFASPITVTTSTTYGTSNTSAINTTVGTANYSGLRILQSGLSTSDFRGMYADVNTSGTFSITNTRILNASGTAEHYIAAGNGATAQYAFADNHIGIKWRMYLKSGDADRQLKIGFGTSTYDSLMKFRGTDGSVQIRTNLNVGSTAYAPASAAMSVTSTTQGFLPPRMTATQASAISSPAEGLLVYVTDTNGTFTAKGWWGYDGAAWQKLNN